MHIGFRTSGGRGEYEVVGGHAGQSAAGLEGWTFHFRWPDGVVRDTLLWLDPGESGKPRLRSLADHPFQVGRLVAAILLFPSPRREMRHVEYTLPVLQSNGNVVAKIGFGPGTEFASPPESVTAEPNYIEVINALQSDFINVSGRWVQIAKICENTDRFSNDVIAALTTYRAFIDAGTPANSDLVRIGEDLRRALAASDPFYNFNFDPLPTLERIAGIPSSLEPPLPPPDQLSEDVIDVKARSAQIYRLAKVRDASARRFSIDVRQAYQDRCVFCGARLVDIPGAPSGIDAAHILAWSSYELDIVSNGLALCKNHHWAFDAAVMVPVIQGKSHFVRFTRLAERLDLQSRAILGTDDFKIPDEWLPENETHRPNAKYLKRLYDDLAIEF